MARYRIYNGAAPTTAKFVAVTTGTAIKTLLQVKLGSTITGKVTAWGISFDGSAAATPIPCELIETDVAATVTAHVAAGCVKYDTAAQQAGDPTTALISVGTAATGYTGTAEGSITATRMLDSQLVAPTNQFIYQWPLGQEPAITPALFLRIRTHAAAAVNAVCFIEVEV